MKLLGSDRSTIGAYTEPVDNPLVSANPSVNFFAASQDEGIREIVCTVFQIGFTTYTGIGIVVPSFLQ